MKFPFFKCVKVHVGLALFCKSLLAILLNITTDRKQTDTEDSQIQKTVSHRVDHPCDGSSRWRIGELPNSIDILMIIADVSTNLRLDLRLNIRCPVFHKVFVLKVSWYW